MEEKRKVLQETIADLENWVKYNSKSKKETAIKIQAIQEKIEEIEEKKNVLSRGVDAEVLFDTFLDWQHWVKFHPNLKMVAKTKIFAIKRTLEKIGTQESKTKIINDFLQNV